MYFSYKKNQSIPILTNNIILILHLKGLLSGTVCLVLNKFDSLFVQSLANIGSVVLEKKLKMLRKVQMDH